ncbi:MAG TPA: ATP synthase F1 subunit delta [Candidatus Methylomirabilis sp.]|nr:ATP synthase F1 subunit delta [Candidatus Methylomirabilis sp.]
MKSTIPLASYVEAYLSVLPAHVDAASDVDALVTALETIKPVRTFVTDASIDALERRKALEAALPQAHDATRNLVMVLSNDGRMKDVNVLPGLVRAVQAERSGKRHAVVTSALPLKAEDMRRISAALERIARMPVTLEERTDASLLAGFRISLGDWSYDSSLKGTLDRLHQSIIV